MERWFVSTLFVLVMCGLSGCSLLYSPPDPYSGYKHTSGEQGYWREDGEGDRQMGELHLHSNGFSVTFEPFETYQDYWGDYTLDPVSSTLRLNVDSGNSLPGFQKAAGTISVQDSEHITLSGICLDSRRPKVSVFKFVRLHPHRD